METPMHIRRYAAFDLDGVVRLCAQENWPSFPEDPARAHRALTAPGVTTMVAVEGDTVAGFAQLQSDGEIQAHLSLLAVSPAFRRRGIGRELIIRALREAGGERIDLLTDDAEAFYASLPHFRLSGFRLYPEYTGPDRSHAGVFWRRGRRVDDPPHS
jgi:ribosomal protein S18 acetylase RimI-like enzyme